MDAWKDVLFSCYASIVFLYKSRLYFVKTKRDPKEL